MSDWLDEWKAASGDAVSGDLETNAPDTPLEDEAAAVPVEPSRSAPRQPRPRRDRRALYALLGICAVCVIGVVAVLTLVDRPGSSENITIPEQTPPLTMTQPGTEPTPSALACEEINTPTRLVTAKPGDSGNPAGLIAAFEHAYFTERDPIAAAEHLAPSMRVTSNAIRGVMDSNFPPGDTPVPYCATVTPWTEPNTWAVSVDWVDERTQEVSTWAAVYEVTAVKGQLRITAQRATE